MLADSVNMEFEPIRLSGERLTMSNRVYVSNPYIVCINVLNFMYDTAIKFEAAQSGFDIWKYLLSKLWISLLVFSVFFLCVEFVIMLVCACITS
jgi:hypothetical protein